MSANNPASNEKPWPRRVTPKLVVAPYLTATEAHPALEENSKGIEDA
jgi:hypothetical protein